MWTKDIIRSHDEKAVFKFVQQLSVDVALVILFSSLKITLHHFNSCLGCCTISTAAKPSGIQRASLLTGNFNSSQECLKRAFKFKTQLTAVLFAAVNHKYGDSQKILKQ